MQNISKLAFLLAILVAYAISPAKAGETVELTDLAGRTVSVQVPVQRIILGEGRFLPTLAILDRDNPVERVVGSMSDFELYDPTGFALYKKHFPSLADIAHVGKSSAASFNLETVISLNPDVLLLGIGGGHSPSEKHTDVLEKLTKAGVPVVFLDFRVEPLANTPTSMKLLGTLMGKEAEAEEFLSFYRSEMDKVQSLLAGIDKRPTVFMELHVGLRPGCCSAMGNQLMGRFIDWAGGKNLVGDQIPGTHGTVSLEYLLTAQPDIYIATAIGSPMTVEKFPERIALGAGATASMARDSLARVQLRKGFSNLDAVTSGKAYAIWHHFYNTPMHVAAIQAMATWFHPDRTKELSPQTTLREFFQRFQPIPLDGLYWTGLE